VLRRIFEPKREGVIGCRKLHEEELHNLYSSLYVFMMWCLIKHRDNYTVYLAILENLIEIIAGFMYRRHWGPTVERCGPK
jgi:hypothetical protein